MYSMPVQVPLILLAQGGCVFINHNLYFPVKPKSFLFTAEPFGDHLIPKAQLLNKNRDRFSQGLSQAYGSTREHKESGAATVLEKVGYPDLLLEENPVS